MHASFCQALFSTNFNLFCAYNIWRFHALHGTISCFETCSCAVLLSYAGARDSIIRLTFFPRLQDRRQKDRAVLPGKEAAQHEQSHGGQHRPGQQIAVAPARQEGRSEIAQRPRSRPPAPARAGPSKRQMPADRPAAPPHSPARNSSPPRFVSTPRASRAGSPRKAPRAACGRSFPPVRPARRAPPADPTA